MDSLQYQQREGELILKALPRLKSAIIKNPGQEVYQVSLHANLARSREWFDGTIVRTEEGLFSFHREPGRNPYLIFASGNPDEVSRLFMNQRGFERLCCMYESMFNNGYCLQNEHGVREFNEVARRFNERQAKFFKKGLAELKKIMKDAEKMKHKSLSKKAIEYDRGGDPLGQHPWKNVKPLEAMVG